jgi:hypothetical protein
MDVLERVYTWGERHTSERQCGSSGLRRGAASRTGGHTAGCVGTSKPQNNSGKPAGTHEGCASRPHARARAVGQAHTLPLC